MRRSQGDGRVAARSAVLPGVRTWQLDCEHGSSARHKEAFEAYLELLQDGSTTARLPDADRGARARAGPGAAAGRRRSCAAARRDDCGREPAAQRETTC